MRDRYRIGNAQSAGSRQVQSNYFATCVSGKNSGSALAVLADGTIDHVNGRRCAILAVEACMHAFRKMTKDGKALQDTEIMSFFDDVTAKIIKDMKDVIFLGKTPYLSCSIQFFRYGKLYYYNVGSSGMFLFDGRDYHILAGTCGNTVFRKGMTAGIISSGVSEACREKELVSHLRQKGHPYGKAQQIILCVKDKNRKMAGNATVLLVEDCL